MCSCVGNVIERLERFFGSVVYCDANVPLGFPVTV